MKKSFMNIKNFVDSNVRQRIDRAANNNNDFYDDELLIVERQFDDLRQFCVEAEKRISAMLSTLNSSQQNTYHVPTTLTNLSHNLTHAGHGLATTDHNATSKNINSLASSSLSQSTTACSIQNISSSNQHQDQQAQTLVTPNRSIRQNDNPLNEIIDELRDDMRRHKKLPSISFLKFLFKSSCNFRPDSILVTTLNHCSDIQARLTKLYLTHEQTIELQCLKPFQRIIEVDIPQVIKLRKLFIKSYNDLELVKVKYNGASHKQQQLMQASSTTNISSSNSYTITQFNSQHPNVNKLDNLKKELDDSATRFEQAKDSYETELYAFVCRETELVELLMRFYQHQAQYQQQVGIVIQGSLPVLNEALAKTPRKAVFGTPLDEHIRCTGRPISIVIEICIHLLYTSGIREEGLFRIPGSTLKIRKLKNAINAWFIMLANQSELAIDHQQQDAYQTAGHASLIAIHDLFKEIVGQRLDKTTVTITGDGISSNSQQSQNNPTNPDESGSSLTINDQPQQVFDVHAIAGLLKLYLRELPEPLFTFSLYESLIGATSKFVNERNSDVLEKLIKELPKANYENLKLLMRFLHLLTTFHDQNKMTSSNLAIAMAPSLIWSKHDERPCKKSEPQQENGSQIDFAQQYNLQISTIGKNASIHAHVIESLINQAEVLFPGQINYTIPYLDELLTLSNCRAQPSSKAERTNVSDSPTGLSTASSSSFSSISNSSSRRVDSDITRAGISDNLNTLRIEAHSPTNTSLVRSSKPPPLNQPTVSLRSQSQSPGDTRTSTRQKPPAPPVPPPAVPKPSECSKANGQIEVSITQNTDVHAKSRSTPKPVSLRGTGTISPVPNRNEVPVTAPRPATRPPLPPSSKPVISASSEESISIDGSNQASISRKEVFVTRDEKSSHINVASQRIVSHLEDVKAGESNSKTPDSPSASLGDTSTDDSFDDKTDSADDSSWTECDPIETAQEEPSGTHILGFRKPAPPPPRPPIGKAIRQDELQTNPSANSDQMATNDIDENDIKSKNSQSTPL